MGTPVEITNGNFNTWYDNQNADRDALQAQSLITTALQVIQLIAYYQLADEAIDNRDRKIDKQWAFMKKISDYECGADYEMLKCKKNVLTDLELPVVDMCADALKCCDEIKGDGEAVDDTSQHIIERTCGRTPDGWGIHDGGLFAAQAKATAGGLIANSSRRQQERFRQQKTDLVRSGQQGMKALFSANSILQKYAQSTAIYSGLADIFIQGFNSAGAGLGVSLGQLSSSTGSSTNFAVGNNAGGASTGLGGIGVGGSA